MILINHGWIRSNPPSFELFVFSLLRKIIGKMPWKSGPSWVSKQDRQGIAATGLQVPHESAMTTRWFGANPTRDRWPFWKSQSNHCFTQNTSPEWIHTWICFCSKLTKLVTKPYVFLLGEKSWLRKVTWPLLILAARHPLHKMKHHC